MLLLKDFGKPCVIGGLVITWCSRVGLVVLDW